MMTAADEAYFVRNARNKVAPRGITPVFIGKDRGRSFFMRTYAEKNYAAKAARIRRANRGKLPYSIS
jgi:hypothetical protein